MRLFISLLLLLPLTSWGYAVGSRTTQLYDASQQRQLTVRIFYPTHSDAPPQTLGENAVFTGYRAIVDAPLAGGKFPLILLSHGSGGSNNSLGWLAVPLAARGAIVVAANHPGSTTGDSRPETDITLQTRDLSFLLDSMLRSAQWQQAIDKENVGAIGHSKGGYSVLALAGGRITRERFNHYCQTMPAMPDCQFYRRADTLQAGTTDARLAADYRDPRVSFVIALDPGMSYVLTPESMAAIDIPVLTLAAGYYRRATGNMTLGAETLNTRQLTLPQAGHFDFLPVCQPRAVDILAEEGESFICETPAAARETVHRQTLAAVDAFITQAERQHSDRAPGAAAARP